jgi:hypothetical protein
MSSDKSAHDLIPNQPERQQVVLCTPFVVSSTHFNGFETETDVEITPEVVTIRDNEGKVITSKIIFHLEPGYSDDKGNIVTEIALGSFGQSDIMRLWMTGEAAGNVFDMTGYVEPAVISSKKKRERKRKLNLDEVLYKCLNVGFFGDPSKYDKENIYSAVPWKELPPELLAEIERRIEVGEPLNYLFLGYAIMHAVAGNLSASKYIELILAKARDEVEASNAYTRRALSGFSDEEINVLSELHSCLYELDYNVEFEGRNVIDPREIYPAFIADLTTPLGQLVSNDSRVNLASTLLSELCLLVHDDISLGRDIDTMRKLTLILDRVREVMTVRIYEKFVEKGFMDDKTLGEFAAEICTLRMNNSDPNLTTFISSRNEAPSLVRAYSRNRRFES